MIVERAAAPIEAVELRGIERAPPPEVLDAIAARRRDPDRPVEPDHLDRPDPRVPGMREALRRAPLRWWR